MLQRRLNQSRESQAMAELGHTAISAPVKWLLAGAFLLTIFSVPLIQAVGEWRRQVPEDGRAGELFAPQFLDVFRHPPSLDHFGRYESELEDRSVVGNWILPRMQRLLMSLGVGNDSTLLGEDGWLFYADDVAHLTGRAFLAPDVLLARSRAGDHTQDAVQPDPIEAIVHFKQQLAARGIELVLVPTPVKPQLYPEKLTPRYDGSQRLPLRNPSFETFRERIEAAGVTVFDPAPLLAGLKKDGAIDPVYLKTDTHWTPPAMQAVAEALVEHLTERGIDLPQPPNPVSYQARQLEHTARGDIFHMLTLPEGVDAGYRPETVTLRQVLPEADPATAQTPSDGIAPFEIEARIDEITRPPRPGTVAYRDAVVSLFLTDVRAVDGREVDPELLIYTLGMRDNEWTPAARLERGGRIRLWIEPWEQVEAEYGAIQRTDITDNFEALMAREYWGHLQPPAALDERGDDEPAEPYWRPTREADVLLIGDSFSNIYSGPGLGWGRSAGFAEQLSLLLERPLDTIIIDGGGAVAGRRQLAADLARGRDRLEGKRLVIWQFANRELSQGHWALIDLPRPDADADADDHPSTD